MLIPEIRTKTITTPKFKNRLIRAEVVADNIGIGFGRLILRSKSPRETIEVRLVDVASIKKVHSTMPSNKLIAKFGTSSPNLRN